MQVAISGAVVASKTKKKIIDVRPSTVLNEKKLRCG